MKTPPRIARYAPVVLLTLTLAAGCARSTTAETAPSVAPLATVSTAGTPGTTPPGSTPAGGSSTRPTTVDPTRSAVPDTGSRPAATATPLFTVSVVPTFYCEPSATLTPPTVVYDDGTVLVADSLGTDCDEVPRVRVGVLDVAELDRLAGEFFDSPEASLDLSELPVTDLPNTTVTYRPADAPARSISVYGLGAEKSTGGGTIPVEQERARTMLSGLIDAVSAPAEHGVRWVPDRLLVVGGLPGGAGYPSVGADDPVRRWPIPLTAAVRKTVDAGRGHRSCSVIAGADDVTAMLEAHGSRPTAARWTVGGHERPLAIGIVLPGFPACSG